jgi:hypothetical protein
MHSFSRLSRRTGAVLASVIILAIVISLQASAPVMAQGGPTPTPTDPIWRAFSAIRDAVEAEHRVDLTIVRSYEWEQAQWQGGIDSCVELEDPNAAREVFFGWTFTITSLRGSTYQGRVSFDLEHVVVCDEVVTAAPPAPAAASGGNLPTPVAGSAVSGSFELGGQALEMSLNTFGLMRRAGMTWVKQQFVYDLGADPSAVAGMINVAHSNGFKILLSIRGHKDQMGDFNGYINTFAQFLAGVAGLGADAIEVWNEPNIDREWPTGSVNGAAYTQMLAAAYNAIKARNPNTMVVSAAPAPTGFFGAAGCAAAGCNDDVFMQQMAAAGAAQYMDCVGLHYNEGIIPPSQNSGDPRGGYPTYYFNSMLARGYTPFGGKPVCFTELGYLSPEGFSTPLPGNFSWAANTSVAEHAAWLAEAATLAAQSGRVRLMIVFNVDFPVFVENDPMGGYAMFRPGGECPACDSLGAVMRR